MDRVRIDAELRAMLREYVRHPERPIARCDHLVFDLEIDGDDASLDMIPEIHRRFGIHPPHSAWRSAATVDDVIDLVQRWQRQPPTPGERTRAEAEGREALHAEQMRGRRFVAAVGVAIGLALAGAPGGGLAGVGAGILFAATLPSRLRERRRLRSARKHWRARRMAEGSAE